DPNVKVVQRRVLDGRFIHILDAKRVADAAARGNIGKRAAGRRNAADRFDRTNIDTGVKQTRLAALIRGQIGNVGAGIAHRAGAAGQVRLRRSAVVGQSPQEQVRSEQRVGSRIGIEGGNACRTADGAEVRIDRAGSENIGGQRVHVAGD